MKVSGDHPEELEKGILQAFLRFFVALVSNYVRHERNLDRLFQHRYNIGQKHYLTAHLRYNTTAQFLIPITVDSPEFQYLSAKLAKEGYDAEVRSA
eukprot:scaffold12761_cov156-Skeletonema_dohrnii-CCMP3373.AAC.1